MPQLFRRRAPELTEETDRQAGAEASAADVDPDGAAPADDESTEQSRARGYTPSKKERGIATPKRPTAHVRRPGVAPTPTSRKNMTKEERQELKEARRDRRREITEGMRRGDPKYLSGRDQGPERAIARDVVDSRRNFGTWFFGGALVVLLGSSMQIPIVVIGANVLFIMMALWLAMDSTILCRKVKRLIRERHPESTQRMGSLYLYVVMRSITFRRMRIPLPRKNLGDPV